MGGRWCCAGSRGLVVPLRTVRGQDLDFTGIRGGDLAIYQATGQEGPLRVRSCWLVGSSRGMVLSVPWPGLLGVVDRGVAAGMAMLISLAGVLERRNRVSTHCAWPGWYRRV